MSKFQFSKTLKAELTANSKAWDELLFKACLEGKASKVKAKEFAEVLRASGFRCGTGPARAAYKAVRNGKNLKGMVAAVTAVKAKRKAAGKDAGKGADGKGADGKGADKGGAGGADKGKADTLAGALTAALAAAKAGHLAVCESWLVKAQAIIETAKQSTTQAVKRMGGIPA